VKLSHSVICLFLWLALPLGAALAQPRWSPEVRAKRETQWMVNTLHLSPDRVNKISEISMEYYRQMDIANKLPGKQKDTKQKQLMRKKDADMKSLLDKEQYQQYYSREMELRRRDKIVYKGRQPE